MERITRRTRPGLESLEGRLLLNSDLTGPNGKPISVQELRLLVLKRENGVPLADRRIAYTTPEGSHVLIYLHGFGSLAGTTVRPDGTLDLVYNNTHADTNIDATVTGGTGRARLGSIRDADVTALDINGVGSEPLHRVNFGSFDLVPGGSINLTGGVGSLYLNSAGPNTQIHLTALPVTTTTTSTTNNNISLFGNQAGANGTIGTPTVPGVSTVSTSGLGSSTSTGGFSVNTGGVATSGTAGLGTGGSSLGTGTTNTGTSGVGTTTGTGTTTGIPGTTTAGTGTTGTTISGTTGSTTTIVTGTGGTTTTPVATGIDVHIRHVNGAPRETPALADPQVFGYDPVANSLIRFDAKTGAKLQAIPLTGMGTAIAGVALGRDAGRLVALVGDGTTIQAFDAVTGAPRGHFSTANLAGLGLKTIDGLGSTETRTVLTDSTAGTLGLAQAIDLTASLASGQAKPMGSVFAPKREFELTGGATGLAGTSTIFLIGAAHFDTFQPDLTQTGILAVSAADTQLSELDRAALPGPASIINAGPAGTARKSPKNAFGSIEQKLALVTGVSGGKNVVTLYNPQTLAIIGTVQFDDPNRLAGLSESFHPELVDSVLLDVQGNLRSFRGSDATGLVINDNGTLNLVQIPRAADSTIVGRPINHVDIPVRSNVTILSTARSVGTRSQVTVDKTLPLIGPLTLP